MQQYFFRGGRWKPVARQDFQSLPPISISSFSLWQSKSPHKKVARQAAIAIPASLFLKTCLRRAICLNEILLDVKQQSINHVFVNLFS